MIQALSIWSDLEQCYHGTNKYGGDTAELYAYRFMPNNPTTHHSPFNAEHYSNAAQSLYAILKHFEQIRECSIMVQMHDKFVPLDESLKSYSFHHRIHVKVILSEK